ncbi:redox-regulated ATPase YchF [Candidatus Woesebacteria bacterium]|nr:redox-regulated ATPase YchF [Candidatus Woesebacteria bacterium]
MKLSIGIVGLPNVGKSTLFNALLKQSVAYTANYPFATIEPNIGVVEVPDDRLPKLAETVKTDHVVPAIVEFYDIAGLVKGASVGEGLGNTFLSHIREVAIIAHVVRLFDNSDIIHVDSTVDPVRDIQTIETELILADLATLEKQKEPRGKTTKEDEIKWHAIQKLQKNLNEGILAKNVALDEKEHEAVQELQLLTMKPVLYVFNVSEKQLLDQEGIKKQIQTILKECSSSDTHWTFLNAKLETDVLELEKEDQIAYLKEFHLEQTGLDRLIVSAYRLLGLISFLTAGEKEVRAWTIKNGTNAQQAAGTIHTDFAAHFIKADVVKYDTFVQNDGWLNCREKGLVKSMGKNYIMLDGDVVEFKVNI